MAEQQLAAVTLLVDDYDRAIDFFTRVLRWQLHEDTVLSPSKRWVRVGPGAPGTGTTLLLARAAGAVQTSAIGAQCGGRVFLFLHTSDFEADVARLHDHGVRFTEVPRDEAYGRVVVFLGLWGNKWDLIEPKPGTPG